MDALQGNASLVSLSEISLARHTHVSRAVWLEWGTSRTTSRTLPIAAQEDMRPVLARSLNNQLELLFWNTELAVAEGRVEEAEEENDLAQLTMAILEGVLQRPARLRRSRVVSAHGWRSS